MRKILLLALVWLAVWLGGCQNEARPIASVGDLGTARIGVWPSSNAELLAKEKLPDADYVYIPFVSDMVQSLKQNKIDAFILEKIYVNNLKSEGIDIAYLPEPIGKVRTGYVFPKTERGQYLCGQMDEFIKKLESSGELDALKQKWFHGEESGRNFTKEALAGENGTIKIATEAVTSPYIYIKNGAVNGYEVELLDKFCAEYGYDYEITVIDFATMMGDVSLGKADIGASVIEYTAERAEKVLFSTATNWDDCVAVVPPDSLPSAKKSLEGYQNARIGCWPQCGYETAARKILPDAEYIYLDSISDLVQNLKQHKIDAFVLGQVYADNLISEGVDIAYLDEDFGHIATSFMFTKSAKGQKLCEQMDEYIAKLEQSGELAKLKEKWFSGGEDKRVLPEIALTGENGTLLVGTDAQSAPYIYLKNGEVTGYEVELFRRFCAEYGYQYEAKVEDFETMLADVKVGKADVGIDAIEYMPERGENMLFSQPDNTDRCVLIVNSASGSAAGFLEDIENRLRASLLTENRWQMIVDGMKTTLIITGAAIIFGTLLGFAVFMLYREKYPAINKIIDRAIRILQGLPQMILLMFFYYVIFGSVDVGGTVVAIVVFSLLLSVSVFIMLKSGTESIPKGQLEAALALGFSERQAFLKFIMPQAVRIFFPTYQKALVELLLSTAIVGYIAVQDLTKMGDLIRARTFDAFVPLIIVSAIYFALSWLLLKILDKILAKLDPRGRKPEEILKGVEI